MKDFEKVKKVYETFEEKYNGLVTRYETQMKENMLSKLENTRLKEKLGMMTTSMEKMEKENRGEVVEEMAATLKSEKKAAKQDKVYTEFPKERENPYTNAEIEKFIVRDSISLSKSFKAHSLGITRMAMHPKKPILATASDDRTWKLWNIPEGK